MAFNSFQIPYDLRVLVERTVGKTRAANGRLMDIVTQILATWLAAVPQNELTIGIIATHQWGMRWSSESAEAVLTWASEIVRAKNFPDLLSVQSRFAYRQIANYDFQSKEFGRLIAGERQGAQGQSANAFALVN